MMNQNKSFYRYLIFLLGITGISLLVLGLTASVSYGQSLGWKPPERISARGQTSWFPDVAVDPAGTVHIVWSSGILDYDLVVHAAFLSDGTIEDPLEIRAMYKTGGEATRPSLFADKNGILHMTFRDTQVYYSQVNAFHAHSGKNWRGDHRVSEGYFSQDVIDSKGRIHYFFTRNVITGTCQVCYHVFYVWSDDGGNVWSEEVDISRGPLGSAKPQVILDENDNLHVVWEAGIGGGYGQLSDTDPTDVMYINSLDNGVTWGAPLQLNPGDMVAKSIAIGMDKNNKLIVVWWDINDDAIFYQTSSDLGKGWSLPIRISGVLGEWSEYHSRLDDYSMAVDGAGNIHLVFVGRLDKPVSLPTPTEDPNQVIVQTPEPTVTPIPFDGRARLSVIHMVWDGKSWEKPEVISSYVGDVPEWPQIAVGLGNQLHVVWFVRAENDIWKGGGDYTVWYSSKTVNAPEFTPVKFPTSTPQETEVVAQIIIDTPTVTPVMDLPENVQVKTGKLVYKEMDYLSVAAFSAIPAVFILAIIILITKRIRR